MPRTDENGKGLPVVLGYALDRTLAAKDIFEALGMSRARYYTRIEEDDFPNAEECRLLAEHFDLNPVDLMLRFGLILKEHLHAAMSPVSARSTSIVTPAKIADLPLNPAVHDL